MTVTLQQLRADIAAIIEEDVSVVGDQDNLMDLGLDSMRAMNLVMQWDEQGVPLDFADLAEAPTLAGLWAILEKRQG
jgi:aryl carrier-like protein